jgi:signal transduction histidine kinase
MSQRRWHQFTVRRLLVLTTAVCAVVAGVWATPLPDFARFTLCMYFLVMIGYEVVRGPSRNAEFRELRQRREQLAAERQAILREAEERRRLKRAGDASADDDAGDAPAG